MTTPCTFLSWDTEFFGQRIARVQSDRLTNERQAEIEQWCAEQNIDCLYFLADFEDDTTIQIAEQSGYHLVDIRMTLGCPIEKAVSLSIQDKRVGIRTVTKADVPQLAELSWNQFIHSRFYRDDCFTSDSGSALFSAWITKSSRDGGIDRVLVAEIEKQPVGYLALSPHNDQGIGQFSLLAVVSTARGQGIGATLVEHGIHVFREQNQRELKVITQGLNIGSQRLFQRFGLRTMQTQLWYHKWYSNCA